MATEKKERDGGDKVSSNLDDLVVICCLEISHVEERAMAESKGPVNSK